MSEEELRTMIEDFLSRTLSMELAECFAGEFIILVREYVKCLNPENIPEIPL